MARRRTPRLQLVEGNPNATARERDDSEDRGIWRARYTNAAGEAMLYAVTGAGRKIGEVSLSGITEERAYVALAQLLEAIDPPRTALQLVRGGANA